MPLPTSPIATKKRRHRFQKLDERLHNLRTDLFLHFKSHNQDASSDSSDQDRKFFEELIRQAENTTVDSFQKLAQAIIPLVKTTELLLHNLDQVTEHLVQALNPLELEDDNDDTISNTVSAKVNSEQVETMISIAVLQLIVALVRELQREAYPYFKKLLQAILKKIDTVNPELTTEVYKTLTVLFSTFRPQLLKNMEAIQNYYFPLLGHYKKFVRDFAAHTVATLLRRMETIKQLRRYLKAYFQALLRGGGIENDLLREGTAMLLYALVRNINGSFHSRSDPIMIFILRLFRVRDDDSDVCSRNIALIFDIAKRLNGHMKAYTDAHNAQSILETYVHILSTEVSCVVSNTGDADESWLYISRLMTLYSGWISYRSGKLVAKTYTPITYDFISKILLPGVSTANPEARKSIVIFCDTVWFQCYDHNDAMQQQIASLFALTEHTNLQVAKGWRTLLIDHIYIRLQQLKESDFHNSQYWHVLISQAYNFAIGLLPLAASDLEMALSFASLIVAIDTAIAFIDLNHSTRMDKLSFVKYCGVQRSILCDSPIRLQQLKSMTHAALRSCIKYLEEKVFNSSELNAVTITWKVLQAMSLIHIESEVLADILAGIEFEHFSNISVDYVVKAEAATIQAEILRLKFLATKSDLNSAICPHTHIIHQNIVSSYSVIDTFVQCLGKIPDEIRYQWLPKTDFEAGVNLLAKNICSPSHQLRLTSLQLLCSYEQLPFYEDTQNPVSTFVGSCDLLTHCVTIEKLCGNVNIVTEREIFQLLDRLKVYCRSELTPIPYKRIALLHCLALYYVKFATIWPHASEVIVISVRSDVESLWPLLAQELLEAICHTVPSSLDTETCAEDRSVITSDQHPVVKKSVHQEFTFLLAIERQEINSDWVTDPETRHSTLWKGLCDISDIVETKTRFVSTLLFVFLRDQYAEVYVDELSSTDKLAIDSAVQHIVTGNKEFLVTNAWLIKGAFSVDSAKLAKQVIKKLVDILRVFSQFRNMRGVYGQDLLQKLLHMWLIKSDSHLRKLSLLCLFSFHPESLALYREHLDQLTQSQTLRETLTLFPVDTESNLIQKKHRDTVVPVLCHLLYAQCIYRTRRISGEKLAARCAAIMSYLSGLESSEMMHFVNLVARPFGAYSELPKDTMALIKVENVPGSRILAFLNMLEGMIAQLGVKMVPYVHLVANLLLSIIHATTCHGAVTDAEAATSIDSNLQDASDVDEDEQGEAVIDDVGDNQRLHYQKQIRSLAIRRFAQLVQHYDTANVSYGIPLALWNTKAISLLGASIAHLQKSVIGATREPALLILLLELAKSTKEGVWMLPSDTIIHVIQCLSSHDKNSGGNSGIHVKILDLILAFLNSLLDVDQCRREAMHLQSGSCNFQMIPHIPLVLEQFVLRFVSRTHRRAETKTPGSCKKELGFLCRISEFMTSGTAPEEMKCAAKNIFQLLLPFLLRNHRTTSAEKEHILKILLHLVPLMEEESCKYIVIMAKHLSPGPNCLKERVLRELIISVLQLMSKQKTDIECNLDNVVNLIQEMNAYDAKKIEEADYDRRHIALQTIQDMLSKDDSEAVEWRAALTIDARIPILLMAQVLFLMHDTEFSIRKSAQSCLQQFLSRFAMSTQNGPTAALEYTMESTVMPCIRFSLKSYDEVVRAGFIHILATLADMKCLHERYAFLPGTDLCKLRNVEDQEVDIYNNLVHIQLHRRRKALLYLTNLLSVQHFKPSTVQNYILPILMHYIYETPSKSAESIQQQAAASIGAAATQLVWSSCITLLKSLLSSIQGHPNSQTAIIQCICAVIDGLTSKLKGSVAQETIAIDSHDAEDVEEEIENESLTSSDVSNKTQKQILHQILPMMKRYMLKSDPQDKKSARASNKTLNESFEYAARNTLDQGTIRIPFALAIVKLIRCLPLEQFNAEFPKLLIGYVKLLQSKDEEVRTSARTTLVKIAVEVGPSYLALIVHEMEQTLRHGYMIYVLNATLHAILEKLLPLFKREKPSSVSFPTAIPKADEEKNALDGCLGSITDIILTDLFRECVVSHDGSEYKSKIKEAKSHYALSSLELLSRSIHFIPESNAIHTILAALIVKYQDLHEKHVSHEKALQAFRSALKAVATGISKNSGVDNASLCMYVQHTMEQALDHIRPLSGKEKTKFLQIRVNSKDPEELDSQATVCTWLVNETSKCDIVQLAQRTNAADTARVKLQPRMTGFDRYQENRVSNKSANAGQQGSNGTFDSPLLEELLYFGTNILTQLFRLPNQLKLIPSTHLNPFVCTLFRCVREAKQTLPIVEALKCLSKLIQIDELSMFNVTVAPLVAQIFTLLQNAGAASTGNEIVQACYRCLTCLLSKRTRVELDMTEAQWRVLLNFVRADLEQREHQQITFALLKVMVQTCCETETEEIVSANNRQLMLPEMYDTMQRVGEMIVQSVSQSARGHAINIFVIFILYYPMGKKRRTQHLHFLLQNLKYPYESGRVAVLQTLFALSKKLPATLLNEIAQLLLLPVILCLANDDSLACREQAAQVIKTLLQQINAQEAKQTAMLIAKWWNTTVKDAIFDHRLVCLAAQVSTILIEARPNILEDMRYVENTILHCSRSWIKICCEHQDILSQGSNDEMANVEAEVSLAVDLIPIWQVLYNILHSISIASNDARFGRYVDMWLVEDDDFMRSTMLKQLLHFPHAWVRLATLQIIANYVRRRIQRSNAAVTENGASQCWLLRSDSAFFLALQLIHLFEKPHFSTNVQQDLLSILPWLCTQMISSPSLADTSSISAREENRDEADRAIETASDDLSEYASLRWIITRLSYLARVVSPLAQISIFKVFAALSQLLDLTQATEYLIPMLNALIRAADDSSIPIVSDGGHQKEDEESPGIMAQLVLELLEKSVGTETFVAKYSFVQKKIKELRANRKVKRKQELVLDPERAVKRKIRKNEQKKVSQQTKKRKYALAQGSTSAVKKSRAIRPGSFRAEVIG